MQARLELENQKQGLFSQHEFYLCHTFPLVSLPLSTRSLCFQHSLTWHNLSVLAPSSSYSLSCSMSKLQIPIRQGLISSARAMSSPTVGCPIGFNQLGWWWEWVWLCNLNLTAQVYPFSKGKVLKTHLVCLLQGSKMTHELKKFSTFLKALLMN